MNIFIHSPKTMKEKNEIQKNIAKIHAQYITYYVNQMQCPTSQKLALIDAVAETIRTNVQTNSKH